MGPSLIYPAEVGFQMMLFTLSLHTLVQFRKRILIYSCLMQVIVQLGTTETNKNRPLWVFRYEC